MLRHFRGFPNGNVVDHGMNGAEADASLGLLRSKVEKGLSHEHRRKRHARWIHATYPIRLRLLVSTPPQSGAIDGLVTRGPACTSTRCAFSDQDAASYD